VAARPFEQEQSESIENALYSALAAIDKRIAFRAEPVSPFL